MRQLTSKVANALDGEGNVGAGGLGDRLAIVDDFEHRELVLWGKRKK